MIDSVVNKRVFGNMSTLFRTLITCYAILILNIGSIFCQTNVDQKASLTVVNAFLNTLSVSQKALTHFSFNDTSRLKWANVPLEELPRKGIHIKDLSDTQRIILHQLLRTVLSTQGYQKILFIMQYDEATHERLLKSKSPIADRYGNKNYCFALYGAPNNDKTWSWKFEGHHISLNFTYTPNHITCTPMFIGINPALITTGDYAGYHILFEENEFGNQLFDAFSDNIKKKATITPLPKDADVMTQIGKEAHLKDKKGVYYREMTLKQQNLMQNIIHTWVGNVQDNIAEPIMKRLLNDKNNLIFTWQGSHNSKELHYYALKTDTFIIEFTNRDQGIYHYHTLWRDITQDFK